MKSENTIKQLASIYEEILRKEKLEIHLKTIDRLIEQKEKAIKNAELKLQKEEADVRQMQSKSIYALFNTFLGRQEQMFEHEKQELLQAHLLKQALENSLTELKTEKEIYLKEYSSKFGVEEDFNGRFEVLQNSLKESHPKLFKKIITFEKSITNHKAKVKEIRQAIKEGQRTMRKLQRITVTIEKVKIWGSLNSKKSITNRSRAMDKIQRDIHTCSNYLSKFEEEIFDLSDHYALDFTTQLEGIRGFLNEFFDNLVTDWIVTQKLENTGHHTSNISDKIARILAMLEHEMNKTKIYIKEDEKLKRDFVMEHLK